MAILNHGSTLRTADGGQTTTTIVTAANIGTYGVATNSTYYVGTTQNIFNRASGAQTLTGVSIDGNAANITAYTVNQNVGTGNAPSFTGMTSTAMLISSTSLTNGDDWSNSPISIRERGLVSAAQSINAYSPNINFHWASRISNSLWMDANGNLAWGSYSETGVPSSDGAFYAANLYASIYYDKNDTAYYVDPASNSRLLNLGLGNVTPDLRLSVSGDAQLSGILYLGGTAGSYNSWGSRTYTTSGVLYNNSSSVEFNNYGYGSTWTFTLGGGNATSSGAFRAPVFYDSDNTAYYLDAANSTTSLLVAGKVGIGTTSPLKLLHVHGTNGEVVRLSMASSYTAGNGPQLSFWNATSEELASIRGVFNETGQGNRANLIFGTRTSDALGVETKMTILHNGNVGIGTTTPVSKLHVVGEGDTVTLQKSNNVPAMAFLGTSTNKSVIEGGDTFNFYTGGSSRFYIKNDGNVGIGTTSPSLISGYVGLNVVNAGYTQIKLQSSASSAGIEFKPSSGNNWELQANTSSQWFVFDRTQDVYRLLINSSGNVGIGTASPSQKLHVVGTAYSDTDFRAPIFYDSNDTGYFLNPNSTSNLNNLRAATISAANHGLTCVYYGGGATPTNGYLITTNIDYSTFNMPTVIIEGYAYGSAAPIHLEIVWYAYNNSWTNLSYTNLGAWDVGTISIGTNASGKVCLHLSNLIYYGRFNIRCIYDGGNAPLEGWTVTDATTSALTRVTTISKSAIVTSITGNSATTTLATKATRANGDFYIDDNYGNTVVGVYSASRYQGVYAMGDSYKLAADGSTTGSLYGIAWSHPNAGGAAGNLSNHGALILINGGYAAAISSSIRCTVDMRTPIYYDSNDTAYYLDPASTSNLNNVTAAGTLTVTNIAKNSTSPIVINSGLSASLGLRVYYDMNLYNTLTFTDSAWNSQGAISGSASVVNITAATATTSFTKYAGYSQEGGSFRAPIFYDSDNTAYYVDPTSTSSVNVVGTNKIRADTNRNFGDDLGWWAHDPYGYGWGKPHGSFRSLEVSSSGNFDTEPALFRIHQWGSGAAEFWKPKGTTLYLRETPGGGGGWFTRFYLEGYGETNGSWRAPIFYDSNNTAYYINPAGNSIVSSLTFDSNITIYKHNDRNLLIQGGGGTDAGLLGRGSSGQFAFQVYGNGSGSYGFLDGAWAGWDIRKVVDGDLFLNDNATYYLNPASTTNLNNLTVAGDVRSPIFYDSNNTAYYLDPASNSVLNGLYVNAYYNLSNDYKDIYVYGDVNTYYVVLIQGEYIYSFGRYSVTRGYNWTGPDTWNTASHKGGLTLDWEWSGDTAWGGNDKAIRIIEFNESYSTMVAGLGYPVNGGVIIWLRGGGVGGAQYRIRTPIGSNTTVTAYDGVSATNHSSSTTFTAANSAVFSSRADVSNVSAEILARYPVRNAASLYSDGNSVVDTGSSTQTKSGIFASAASVRAPIFYDTDNTGYYVDPNSTSNLVGLTVANTITGSISGNSGTVGGLSVHSGRNNEANKVVRTDSNGYIQAGWINTTSGNEGTTAIDRVYASYDGYIRYYTPANFRTVLDVPTRGGSGASGSWGISVTGSSASCTGNSATTTLATKATRANGDFYIDDNYGNTVVGVYTSTRYQGVYAMGDSYKLAADGTTTGTLYGIAWSHQNAGGAAANLASHGLLILENGVFKGAWGGGSLRTPGDVRGTLFYDWDNTGYYCDPASTSNLNAITAAGNITAAQYYTGGWFRNNASGNGLYNEATGQHFYSDSANYWNVASSASTQGIRFRTGGHAGTVRGYIIADTNNDVGLLNQDGNWRVRVVGGDYTIFDGSSIRAQIFYDSNDTGYYTDPAGTSILNVVRANSYVQKSASQSLSGTVGCTIDVAAAGIHVLTLAASTTISSFTYNYRAPNPSVNTIMLVIKYGGTASITWTNVLWANGVTPTITGVSGYADVYMLTSYQGTTGVWIGTVVSQGVVSTSL